MGSASLPLSAPTFAAALQWAETDHLGEHAASGLEDALDVVGAGAPVRDRDRLSDRSAAHPVKPRSRRKSSGTVASGSGRSS